MNHSNPGAGNGSKTSDNGQCDVPDRGPACPPRGIVQPEGLGPVRTQLGFPLVPLFSLCTHSNRPPSASLRSFP